MAVCRPRANFWLEFGRSILAIRSSRSLAFLLSISLSLSLVDASVSVSVCLFLYLFVFVYVSIHSNVYMISNNIRMEMDSNERKILAIWHPRNLIFLFKFVCADRIVAHK